MAFLDSGTDPSQGGGPPTPDQSGGGGAAPPPGGGPIINSIQRQRQGAPQTSAPGQGNMADGMNSLKLAAQMIQQALPNIPIGSPLHASAINALRQLTRHIGQMGPMGTQQTALQDALRSNMRNQLMTQIMQRQSPSGPGGPMGTAGQPQPPMPSTPLPGA